MPPMTQEVEDRCAGQPDRRRIAEGMDVHRSGRGQGRVDNDGEASGGGIDRGERGYRSRRYAEQPLHILRLAETDALAADRGGQGLQVDTRLRRYGDEPIGAAIVLEEQILGMLARNGGVHRVARSEERRVGNECASTVKYWLLP